MSDMSSKHDYDHYSNNEEEEDGNHRLISTFSVPGMKLSALPYYLI